MKTAAEQAAEAKLQADLAQMQNALTELQNMFGQAVDIHTHTRRIGQLCRTIFFPVDEHYGLTQSTLEDFERTAAEIQDWANTLPGTDKVRTVLNSVRAFRDKTDHETGLPIMQLLMNTWKLAKMLPHQNAPSLVIENLRHNKETGGGCYPGIAARLVQPYSVFLHEILKDQQYQSVQDTAHSTAAHDDDAELAQAIAQSLQTSEPSNNLDLQRAPSLSMQPMPHPTQTRFDEEDRVCALGLLMNGLHVTQTSTQEEEAIRAATEASLVQHHYTPQLDEGMALALQRSMEDSARKDRQKDEQSLNEAIAASLHS